MHNPILLIQRLTDCRRISIGNIELRYFSCTRSNHYNFDILRRFSVYKIQQRPIVTTTDGTYRSQIAVAKKRSSRDEKENETSRQDEKESSEWTSSCSTKSHRRGNSCHKCRDNVKHVSPSGSSRWSGRILGKVSYIFDLAVYSVTILILTVGGTFGTSDLKLDIVGVSTMKFILCGMIYAI